MADVITGCGRCDLIVTDRPDNSSVFGADEHDHDGHAENYDQDTDPHKTLFFIVGEAKSVCIQSGGSSALGKPLLSTEGDVVDQVDNDHTKAEGDDRQIISFQTKGRDTDEQSDQRGQNTGGQNTDDQRDHESEASFVCVETCTLKSQGDKRCGVGTGGHEATVTKRELSQIAEHQIQGGGHNDQIAALPYGGSYL